MVNHPGLSGRIGHKINELFLKEDTYDPSSWVFFTDEYTGNANLLTFYFSNGLKRYKDDSHWYHWTEFRGMQQRTL